MLPEESKLSERSEFLLSGGSAPPTTHTPTPQVLCETVYVTVSALPPGAR